MIPLPAVERALGNRFRPRLPQSLSAIRASKGYLVASLDTAPGTAAVSAATVLRLPRHLELNRHKKAHADYCASATTRLCLSPMASRATASVAA
jgi:hypothetical protein